MSLLWLFLVSSTMGAPQMSLDTRYQDIFNSFNRIKPSLQNIPTALGDFGQDFNSHLGQFGNSLGSQIGSIGSSLGNVGNMLGDQVGNIGREVDAFGNRLEQTIHRQMDNIPNMLDRVGERFDTIGGNIGQNFHDFGQSFGSDLLDQFDQQMGSLGTFESDMFGSMFGGRPQAPWWKGDNVCVERKVVEEEPENVKLDIVGNINFQMQVAQCKEGEGFYECQNTQGAGGALQTFKVRYTCCHGFSLTSREGCTEVDLSPLEETIGELGGSEFLDLLVSTGLDDKLDNVTLFVPDDEAMDDFQVELEQLKQLEPAENVVYSVDDGLLSYKRKKRNVMIVAEQELPDIPHIVAGHMVDGFVSTRDIAGDMMVTSENSGKVRLTSYGSGKVVMANCARITSRDNMATNGMVHMVDRVLRPATQTVGEILAEDQHFRTFVTSLEEHGLVELLDSKDGVTVFAPTDKAFEKLDSEGLGKVLGGGNCAREVLLTHVLPSVLCSGVVEESGVSVTNIAGRKMGLQMDDDGNVLVENIKLVMKDKMATNGVIHVIEEVIIQDSVKNVMEHLESKKAKKLLDLLETSGLGKNLETMSNITFFAPSEKALSELPAPLLEELGKDPKKLEEILMHHVTTEKKTSCDLTNNQQLDTLGGQTLRVNLHKHFGHSRPLATIQCARVLETNQQVCGGHVHVIDRVLTPPTGDLVNTLAKDHKQFASLLDFAGVAGEFSGSLHTILAPEDSAFDKLDNNLKTRLFSDKEVAASVVRNHVLSDAICCAAVPRITGFFQLRLDRRSLLGHRLGIRRSHGGHIYVNHSAFTRCDVAATDGVLHSVSEVLLPPDIKSQQPSTGRRSFWLF